MPSPTLTKTIFIKASPEAVWAYLTEAKKLGKWYHEAKVDLANGAPYELLDNEGNGTVQVWGRVLEMQPPTLLRTTFCVEPFGDNDTTLTWTLEAASGGTLLTLVHEGISEAAGEAAFQMFSALDAGWDSHFERLRATFS